MRPIKLTVEGFTSFRQQTAIDFAGLDLFAITGPTGSGKTSILDAITYALYGQTSRLGGKGLGELITLGAPRLSVMLDFESGGKCYRVARVLKRSGPATVRLETLDSGSAHPFESGAREVASQIEKIVGLEFDAFTKAVVLPQGEFDQFLRGDPAERRQILEALLNLGVYRDMMQLANARQKERQTERDLINTQLDREYTDATEANRQVLATEIEKLIRGAELATAELKRVEEARSPAIELRQKREAAVTAERDQKAAEHELGGERSKESTLSAQVERQQQIVQRLQEQLQKIAYDEVLHQNLIASLPVAQQLEKTESDHATKVQEKGEKSHHLEGIEAKLQAAKREHEQAAKKALATEEAHAAAKEKFATLREKYGSVDMVEHVAGEIENLGVLEQQLQRDQEEQTTTERRQTDLAGSIDRLGVEEATAQKAFAEAQQAYETLFRKHSAEELRKHLKAGEPCPVCEQVVARLPKRVPAAHLDQAKASAKKHEQTYQRVQQALANAKAEFAGLPRQLQAVKLAVGRTSKQMKDLREKAERILGKVPGADATTRLKRIATDLRTAESDCMSKERETNKAAQAEVKAKDAMTQLERDVAVLRRDIQSLSRQIEAATNEIERLGKRLGVAPDVKTIQAGLTAQQRAKQQRAEIETKISSEQKSREEALKQLQAVATQIAVLKDRIDRLNKAVDRAKSDSARIEQTLKKKLAGLALPEGADEAERIDTLLSELRTRCGELSRLKDQKELHLDQLEIRIAEAEKKRARVVELERSALVYAQLGTLLRADQFIRFVLEDAFQLLCNEGARQLQVLSQGRYSFHTENNEFHVIDHWNADERRSVRTLSGGESFLASLALALALSSSVLQFSDGGPVKLDALFLDEGFSTLDAETLNVAIDSLQALQEGDRMIAVISHVTDLADRLPARIQVIKGISGSEIRLEQESAAATT